MVEPTAQPPVAPTPMPPKQPASKGKSLLWAAMCVALAAMIGVGVLGWQLVETQQDLADLRKTADRHSDQISSAKSDITTIESDTSTLKADAYGLKTTTSTLEDDVSALQNDTSSIETDVSALQTATAAGAATPYGPLTVYCASLGVQTIHIEKPMSRVNFNFSATGTQVSWMLLDDHLNVIIDNSSFLFWSGAGSFIAAEEGDYEIWLYSSTTAVVSVSYTVYAPAPVVAGS